MKNKGTKVKLIKTHTKLEEYLLEQGINKFISNGVSYYNCILCKAEMGDTLYLIDPRSLEVIE